MDTYLESSSNKRASLSWTDDVLQDDRGRSDAGELILDAAANDEEDLDDGIVHGLSSLKVSSESLEDHE